MSLSTIQNVLFFLGINSSLWLTILYFHSSTSIVLGLIIWSLVFHYVILRVYLTSVEAFLIIFKHATFLRKSNALKALPEVALTQAELDYQKANIELRIQEYLKSFPPEDSVETFSGFIMATELGLFIFLIYSYHNILLCIYCAFSISALNQNWWIKKSISVGVKFL